MKKMGRNRQCRICWVVVSSRFYRRSSLQPHQSDLPDGDNL